MHIISPQNLGKSGMLQNTTCEWLCTRLVTHTPVSRPQRQGSASGAICTSEVLETLVAGGKKALFLFGSLLSGSTKSRSLSHPSRCCYDIGSQQNRDLSLPYSNDNQAYTQITSTFQVNLVLWILFLPTSLQFNSYSTYTLCLYYLGFIFIKYQKR